MADAGSHPCVGIRAFWGIKTVLQKAVFCTAEGGLSVDGRPPFAMRLTAFRKYGAFEEVKPCIYMLVRYGKNVVTGRR